MAVRTTRITVEQDTIMIIRRASVELIWCSLCGAEAEVISLGGTVQDGVRSGGLPPEWAASGRLHILNQPDGSTCVCLPSLLGCFEHKESPTINIAKENL
jgi:hypothetical protein